MLMNRITCLYLSSHLPSLSMRRLWESGTTFLRCSPCLEEQLKLPTLMSCQINRCWPLNYAIDKWLLIFVCIVGALYICFCLLRAMMTCVWETPINQPTAGMTHDFERYSLDFVRSKSFLLCISNMFSILSSPIKWIGSGKSFSFLL